jgi:CRP-like cAMP-binding protein
LTITRLRFGCGNRGPSWHGLFVSSRVGSIRHERVPEAFTLDSLLPSIAVMTDAAATPTIGTDNMLLGALPEQDRARLATQLEPVPLPFGKVLYEPDVSITHVYFPFQGVISIVSEMDRGTVEIGTVGREGMLGVPVLLASDSTALRAFVQVEGRGVRLAADRLAGVLDSLPALRRLLLRYTQSLFDQVAQSVACNRLHTLEERCARWLLMVHDRVGEETLPLKQAFLADMLGVHRPAVTLAAGALQRAGLIRYSRGKVHVLDRTGLENAACRCYAIVRARLERSRRV